MTDSVTTHVSLPGSREPLGVTVDGDGVNVAVWSPEASFVEFCVFDEDREERRIELAETDFHVFHGHIPGLGAGTRYGFRAHGPWAPEHGHRFNPHKLLLDPYARAIDGTLRLGTELFAHRGLDDHIINHGDSGPLVPLSVVVDDHFDWEGVDHPRVPWSETVLYEMHVKGFTRQHPDIPDDIRGTYAGLAHPVAVDYLRDLGVTSVELLPIHHFIDEIPLLERGLSNYWGYNSMGFFAPHGPYSSRGTRGEQVTEFKSMVKALHSAGIEVILDVVYNHTAEGNHLGPIFGFRGLSNSGYYKLGAEDPAFYADYTGCGNTVDASNPQVLRLILDSLRYWVEHMHVDGFRFDLASALTRQYADPDLIGSFLGAIGQDPVLRNVKLIAEPWDVGAGGYLVGQFPNTWAEWNDKYRDCMRDFWRGMGTASEFGRRMSGSADLYEFANRQPYCSVNFVTAHDGFTLRDLVSYQDKHNEANGEDNADGNDDNRAWNSGAEGETADEAVNALRRRRIRSLLTTLVLAGGTPMLVAGDEFGRTQHGNNNAYCQDNEISWLDWNHEPWQQDLREFTKALLALRRDHVVFRQKRFANGEPVSDDGPMDLAWFGTHGQILTADEWNDPSTKSIGVYLSGHLRTRDLAGEPHRDQSFLLLLNADHETVDFTLPEPPYGARYRVRLHTDEAQVRGTEDAPLESGESITVHDFAGVLLEVIEPATTG